MSTNTLNKAGFLVCRKSLIINTLQLFAFFVLFLNKVYCRNVGCSIQCTPVQPHCTGTVYYSVVQCTTVPVQCTTVYYSPCTVYCSYSTVYYRIEYIVPTLYYRLYYIVVQCSTVVHCTGTVQCTVLYS